MPRPAVSVPRIMSGRSASHALIRICWPSIVTGRVVSQDASAGVWPAWRRRSTSRSITASVPAVRRCEPVGSRTAPSRSATALISRRAAGFAASSVNRELSTATSPPGRVNASDLRMKWLWIECRAARCALGHAAARPRTARSRPSRSKCPSGRRVSANDSHRTVACG